MNQICYTHYDGPLGTRDTVSADAAAKALVGSTVAGAKGTIAGAEVAAAMNQQQNLSGHKDPCK